MAKNKKQKKYHYDYDSFFIDDVLKEIKKRNKKPKRVGLTC